MVYKNFSEIIEQAKSARRGKRIAIAAAEELQVIEAALKAFRDGIAYPYLIGDKKKILNIITNNNFDIDVDENWIIDADTPEMCAFEAVRLVREGKADFLMKGLIETGTMMKELINRDTGILAGGLISHMSISTLPGYHKVIGLTDAAIVDNPDLDKKKSIVQNAVNAMRSLGYERPKVAALCAIEKVNPKMTETVEADALKKMVESGEITDCIFEGPISCDLALDPKAAKIKGYMSPVSGDPDILLMPNLSTGNIAIKLLRQFAGCSSVGIVLGAKVPMVLISRSADAAMKYNSIAVVSEMNVDVI